MLNIQIKYIHSTHREHHMLPCSLEPYLNGKRRSTNLINEMAAVSPRLNSVARLEEWEQAEHILENSPKALALVLSHGEVVMLVNPEDARQCGLAASSCKPRSSRRTRGFGLRGEPEFSERHFGPTLSTMLESAEDKRELSAHL
jgi:hypothetical protein